MGFPMVLVDHDRRMADILHNVGLVCCAYNCRKHHHLHGPIFHKRPNRNDNFPHDRYSYRLEEKNGFFKNNFFANPMKFVELTFTSISLLAQRWLPWQIIVKVLALFTVQTFGVVRTITTPVNHIDLVRNTFQW